MHSLLRPAWHSARNVRQVALLVILKSYMTRCQKAQLYEDTPSTIINTSTFSECECGHLAQKLPSLKLKYSKLCSRIAQLEASTKSRSELITSSAANPCKKHPNQRQNMA